MFMTRGLSAARVRTDLETSIFTFDPGDPERGLDIS